MSLLGIEVSVAGCRALAVSLDGRPLAQSYHEHPLPTVGAEGVRELDTRAVWAAARQTIADIATRTRHDPIRALSLCSGASTLAPLSAEGQILGHAILAGSQWGAQTADLIAGKLGIGRQFELTGHVPHDESALPALCWLREHQPGLLREASWFLPWSSLIAFLLGGASACDESSASATGLFDLRAKQWSREVLEACGVPLAKLPDVAAAGRPIGTVSSAVARELGLPPGVRMALGGHNLGCNALGAGCIRSGTLAYALGAQLALIAPFQAVPLTSLMLSHGLSMGLHVAPGLLVTFWHVPWGRAMLRWFRDALAAQEKRLASRRGSDVYEELWAEMPEGPSGLFFLPPVDTDLTGLRRPVRSWASGGAAIVGLTPATTRGEMLKALLEGLSFDVTEGQALLEQVGIRVERLRATGGGARSERWLQLTADVLGLSVERTQISEAGALGAAILAGVGSGAFADIAQAVATLVRVQHRFEPDGKRAAVYRSKLERQRRLVKLLGEEA